MRFDLEVIKRWIPQNSRVLDLGCGQGELLANLREHSGVEGYGLEIDSKNIEACLKKGLNVIEQDLDKGLANFSNDSFDVVVMTQTLQAVHYPDQLLEDMVRVGRMGIVTFPNFGHWRCRWDLSIHGRMPVSEFMPFGWYDTPNIHFCTFKDLEDLCRSRRIKVMKRLAIDRDHKLTRLNQWWPNLMGEIGIYSLTKDHALPSSHPTSK